MLPCAVWMQINTLASFGKATILRFWFPFWNSSIYMFHSETLPYICSILKLCHMFHSLICEAWHWPKHVLCSEWHCTTCRSALLRVPDTSHKCPDTSHKCPDTSHKCSDTSRRCHDLWATTPSTILNTYVLHGYAASNTYYLPSESICVRKPSSVVSLCWSISDSPENNTRLLEVNTHLLKINTNLLEAHDSWCESLDIKLGQLWYPINEGGDSLLLQVYCNLYCIHTCQYVLWMPQQTWWIDSTSHKIKSAFQCWVGTWGWD